MQGNCFVFPVQGRRTDHCFLQLCLLHFSLSPNAFSFKLSLHKFVPSCWILKKMTCEPFLPLSPGSPPVGPYCSCIKLDFITVYCNCAEEQTLSNNYQGCCHTGEPSATKSMFQTLKTWPWCCAGHAPHNHTGNSNLPRNFFCQFISLKRSSDFMKKSLILLPCSSLSVV